MGSIAIYLSLGTLDAFAVFVLILKIYRLPLKEYILELGTMSVFIAIVSFVLRIVLNVPYIDLAMQVLLFTLFMRFVMQIKLFYGAIITGVGLGAYLIIQVSIYGILSSIGLLNEHVVLQTTGTEVNFVQALSITLAFTIGYVLKKFNLGFSFIIYPPHDFSVKEDYTKSRNRALLFWAVATLVVLSISLPALLNMKMVYVAPFLLISFAALYFQSIRRDIED
ncbi:hypothetical protein [Paenibacillus thiaminolyticus]|uniref:hypothetical protein n=1 Tax=Paenibacillus thiaminolyticus TaxID=49283 RepID=UPI0025429008|nr:hypothetical protein [Paenibacillus thiaminolyticus]WII39219.1 hypothetical protein O0V01_09065 [Paenibacillus thiaminolyticus]